MTELTNYIDLYPESLFMHLADLLNALLPRLMDDQHRIHVRVRVLLQTVFEKLGDPARTIVEPFASLIINYVICALTHINGVIAMAALKVVDLLPQCLDLKAVGEDGRKLLTSLMSMICTSTEGHKGKRNVQLHSVGHFANAQARLAVINRISIVIEALCRLEDDEKVKNQKTVSWTITRPGPFTLPNPLAVDLVPRSVSWTHQLDR